MKIAQFTNTTDGGGAETLMLSLSQQLIKEGHKVEIHAFEKSWVISRCYDLNIPYVALGQEYRIVHPIRKLPLWRSKYGSLLKQRRIDVIHSHCYGPTLRGAAAAFYANIPHVATQHDNHSIDEKTKSRVRWLNIAGFLGTKIVTISNQMINYYIERGVKRKYCCFVHNGVASKRFLFNFTSAYNIRRQHHIKDDEIVFIAPARLEQIKGFDVLIKAFNHLYDKQFKLLILGEGSQRQELERIVQLAELSDKIKFVGLVNNVEEYLSAADVFTLASRNEGLPCSIIEAMFAGLPIVTTDVGGNSELVYDGKNGHLVPSEDDVALAARLGEMIDCGRNKLRAMGAESFSHAQNFSLETMAKKYISLYNGVCLTN